MRSSVSRTTAIVLAGALALAGCAEADANPDEGGEVVTVGADDYAFPDLAAEYGVGTTFVLRNDSEVEVHEIMALRVDDDEPRPGGELLKMPPPELMGSVELAGVALAPPMADSASSPAPPLVVAEPGRYLFVCLIPTGAPPDEVMAAVQDFVEAGAPEGDAPDYPETGPPHAANGMFAEVTITP